MRFLVYFVPKNDGTVIVSDIALQLETCVLILNEMI